MSEGGVLFSIVAVNMSLASLAGLVIAFRRTGAWAMYDIYRLRQIVEWGFSGVLLALAGFPLASWLGGEAAAIRLLGAIALAYLTLNLLLLTRRRAAVRDVVRLTPLVATIDLSAIAFATATLILATMTAWQLALLALTARPMIAFLMVLSTLGREDPE